MNLKIILFSILLFNNLNAEFSYSGKIHLPYNFNLKTYKNTELPIRFVDLNLNYSFLDIDFKSNIALEYDWGTDPNEKINFREYYFSYYPSFGEITIGKQIISWGFADGNNPTDNINPYDFNYMFASGVDRKVGIYSISSTLYYDDFKINLVMSYDEFKHRFNSQIPFECFIYGDNDYGDCLNAPEFNRHIEYGVDFQYNMNQAEIAISYLNSRDRFHNENIQMIGTNLLYMYDEFTFRFENAFYIANKNEKFLQGIIQVEYPELFKFNTTTQLFGTYDFNAKKIYGIGPPLFILSEYMIVISTSRIFLDDTIELNNFILYNLGKGHGYSVGTEINYTLNDYIQSSINISKFFKGSGVSSFNNLEKHSNLKISLTYFF